MASHGFRVYTMVCRYRGAEEDMDLAVDSMQQLWFRMLELLARKGPIFGKPKSSPDDDGEIRRTVPTVTFEEPVWVAPRHLHVVVHQGEAGLHERLVAADGEEQDIREASAEVAHRIDIIFPTDGATALIVAEVVGMKDASSILRAQMVEEQHLVTKALRELDRKAAALARKNQETAPPAVDRPYLYLKIRRTADGAQLRSLIREAEKAEAQFIEYVPSPRGTDAVVRKRQLTINLLTESERDRAIKRAMAWVKRKADAEAESGDTVQGWKKGADDGDSINVVAEMADDFGLSSGGDGSLAAGFDEVAIQLEAKGGGSRTLSPFKVDELFTYHVADGQPSMIRYYEKAIPKLSELARAHKIAVRVGSPQEVAECLVALTFGPSGETSEKGSASA